MIEKILITNSGKRFFVRELDKDYHTQYGFVKKRDLKAKDGKTLFTNKGIELKIFSPCFIDLYSRIKRGAQIIMPKDIALIIAETGLGKNSRVLDAGSGSGALACFLANIAKEIITYEVRKDHCKIVKSNIGLLGLENIKLRNKDITETKEKNIDVIILDLPEPWKLISKIKESLKIGGFLATYSPSITQIMETVNKINKSKEFTYIKTIESLQREWHIEGRKVRPRTNMIAHTGFLSFARKIK